MSLAPEIARRQSHTEKVLALFMEKPLQWIGVHELAHVGGFAAWRTRVSEARTLAEAEHGCTIDWNGQVKDSAYRYRPLPLGPDAATTRAQLSLGGWR